MKMKRTTAKITIVIMAAIIATSCDSPRSQRSILGSNSNSLTNNGFNPTTTAGSTTNGSTTSTGSTTENTTTASVVPEDAKHCKFSTDGINNFATNHTHLGYHTLCKSSTDANSFYFQLKTPPVGTTGDVNICFIPTTSSGSNSIYVGNPMCGSFSDPKAVKKITFVKYSSYTNASINGVIFFKDTSYYYPVFNRVMMTLAAYQGCMNMLAYGNSAYCDAFKSVGQYVYQAF